ncbi:MAG: hypothetical protein ACK2U1_08110, partial [Anaerolineales bacterium]
QSNKLWFKVAFPSSCSDATAVQNALENMKTMDTADKISPIYGTRWTPYHHMYGVDVAYDPFESVGCAFESHRGCLFLYHFYFYIKELLKFIVFKMR